MLVRSAVHAPADSQSGSAVVRQTSAKVSTSATAVTCRQCIPLGAPGQSAASCSQHPLPGGLCDPPSSYPRGASCLAVFNESCTEGTCRTQRPGSPAKEQAGCSARGECARALRCCGICRGWPGGRNSPRGPAAHGSWAGLPRYAPVPENMCHVLRLPEATLSMACQQRLGVGHNAC